MDDVYYLEDEYRKARSVRQKTENGQPVVTYPMIHNALELFKDPTKRKEIFEAELQRLQRYPPDKRGNDTSTPEWIRQLKRAIQEQERAIRDWDKAEDCLRMRETFAQNMAITSRSGVQGRAGTARPGEQEIAALIAADAAGGEKPVPAVRGICGGARRPSTGPTNRKTVTWSDIGRPPTDPSRETSVPGSGAGRPPAGPSSKRPVRGGDAGKPPTGPLGKGPVPGVPAGRPPAASRSRRSVTASGGAGRPPANPSGHIVTTGQGSTAREGADPSSSRVRANGGVTERKEAVGPSSKSFHATRGYNEGQTAGPSSGTIAINADDGQMGAAGLSGQRNLGRKNDDGGQDSGREPVRPSRPRRLTERVDDWMDHR